jgi:hypothetical protein
MSSFPDHWSSIRNVDINNARLTNPVFVTMMHDLEERLKVPPSRVVELLKSSFRAARRTEDRYRK